MKLPRRPKKLGIALQARFKASPPGQLGSVPAEGEDPSPGIAPGSAAVPDTFQHQKMDRAASARQRVPGSPELKYRRRGINPQPQRTLLRQITARETDQGEKDRGNNTLPTIKYDSQGCRQGEE